MQSYFLTFLFMAGTSWRILCQITFWACTANTQKTNARPRCEFWLQL